MRTGSRLSASLGWQSRRLLLWSLIALALSHQVALSQEVTDPLEVVVSIHPWADLVSRVGGEDVEVTALLPAGASPHAFEPLPSQATLLGQADLVVLNGGLDGWLARLLDAVAPAARRLVLMDLVDFVPIQADEHDSVEGSRPAVADAANPHIWLDPVVAARAVAVVATELSTLRPESAQRFESRARALEAELAQLDADLTSLLAPVRDRPFVPFHDAWAYFARRYRLNLVATLEPFPGREPSARYVAETVLAVRRAGARVIFDERQLSGRTARVVAESGGLQVVTLDPIGGPPGPESYFDLLRHNARLIAEALAE